MFHTTDTMAMVVFRSKFACILYMFLFHALYPAIKAGSYYKVIASKDEAYSVAAPAPHIRKEFFQCGRDQSCTHVLRIVSRYVLVYGSEEFEKREHEADIVYEKIKLPGNKSLCTTYFRRYSTTSLLASLCEKYT